MAILKGIWRAIVFVAGKLFSLVGALIIGGAGVAFLAYLLSTRQDLRERNFKFQEVTQEAEKLYCEKKETGVPSNLKVLIDQAIYLEPGLREELTSLNYITLASVGSVVLPYEQVHEFGERALERATVSGNTIDKYVANLILGHIEFARFDETHNRSHLNQGRDYFKSAKHLVDDAYSQRSQYFSCQLLLVWGLNELFVGEETRGKDALRQARGLRSASAEWRWQAQRNRRSGGASKTTNSASLTLPFNDLRFARIHRGECRCRQTVGWQCEHRSAAIGFE